VEVSDWLHPGLRWLSELELGRTWLARLPTLVQGCSDEWSLTVGPPFEYAYASLALPATLSDGTEVVLKIQFPHRESLHEATALEVWDGDGAVKLLAHDSERSALLLERCQPGTPLWQLEQDPALDIAIDLLPRLWKPAGTPFTSLSEEAGRWADDLAEGWKRTGKPFEERLLGAAMEALENLPGSQGEQVLLHQDLHAGNILRAQREPWLVIDPKPLTGERDFGIAALVRGDELGHGPQFVRRRFTRLTTELGLDRERARGWTIAQTLAWAFGDDDVLIEHVDCARWLVDAGD
jgi:streptomycin 6-kinase